MRMLPTGASCSRREATFTGPAYDGVVHPVLASEIADRAIAGMNPYAAAERRLDPGGAPNLAKLAHPLLHGERHFYAGKRVLLDPARFRDRRRTASSRRRSYLSMRRSMLERHLRHLGQIMI